MKLLSKYYYYYVGACEDVLYVWNGTYIWKISMIYQRLIPKYLTQCCQIWENEVQDEKHDYATLFEGAEQQCHTSVHKRATFQYLHIVERFTNVLTFEQFQQYSCTFSLIKTLPPALLY